MADVKVENRSSEQGRQRSLSRRGEFAPARDLYMHPYSMMRRLSGELDRAMAGAFGFSPSWSEESGMTDLAGWSPEIEVREEGNNMVVCADLPGVKKDDIKVEVTDQGLIIRGERKQEHEEKRQGFYRSERSYGSFSRLVPVPEGVDAEKIEAHYKDGVLEVKVPIPESQRARQKEIPIKS